MSSVYTCVQHKNRHKKQNYILTMLQHRKNFKVFRMFKTSENKTKKKGVRFNQTKINFYFTKYKRCSWLKKNREKRITEENTN